MPEVGSWSARGRACSYSPGSTGPRAAALPDRWARVSWLPVRLSEVAPRRTRLDPEHLVPSDDPTWDEFGPGAVGVGWDMALLGLATHLRTGAPVDPEAAMQWTTSQEGKAAMTESSNAWAAANIAAGTDEDEARVAATRTTAAYTAAPSPEPQGEGSSSDTG